MPINYHDNQWNLIIIPSHFIPMKNQCAIYRVRNIKALIFRKRHFFVYMSSVYIQNDCCYTYRTCKVVREEKIFAVKFEIRLSSKFLERQKSKQTDNQISFFCTIPR